MSVSSESTLNESLARLDASLDVLQRGRRAFDQVKTKVRDVTRRTSHGFDRNMQNSFAEAGSDISNGRLEIDNLADIPLDEQLGSSGSRINGLRGSHSTAIRKILSHDPSDAFTGSSGLSIPTYREYQIPEDLQSFLQSTANSSKQTKSVTASTARRFGVQIESPLAGRLSLLRTGRVSEHSISNLNCIHDQPTQPRERQDSQPNLMTSNRVTGANSRVAHINRSNPSVNLSRHTHSESYIQSSKQPDEMIEVSNNPYSNEGQGSSAQPSNTRNAQLDHEIHTQHSKHVSHVHEIRPNDVRDHVLRKELHDTSSESSRMSEMSFIPEVQPHRSRSSIRVPEHKHETISKTNTSPHGTMHRNSSVGKPYPNSRDLVDTNELASDIQIKSHPAITQNSPVIEHERYGVNTSYIAQQQNTSDSDSLKSDYRRHQTSLDALNDSIHASDRYNSAHKEHSHSQHRTRADDGHRSHTSTNVPGTSHSNHTTHRTHTGHHTSSKSLKSRNYSDTSKLHTYPTNSPHANETLNHWVDLTNAYNYDSPGYKKLPKFSHSRHSSRNPSRKQSRTHQSRRASSNFATNNNDIDQSDSETVYSQDESLYKERRSARHTTKQVQSTRNPDIQDESTVTEDSVSLADDNLFMDHDTSEKISTQSAQQLVNSCSQLAHDMKQFVHTMSGKDPQQKHAKQQKKITQRQSNMVMNPPVEHCDHINKNSSALHELYRQLRSVCGYVETLLRDKQPLVHETMIDAAASDTGINSPKNVPSSKIAASIVDSHGNILAKLPEKLCQKLSQATMTMNTKKQGSMNIENSKPIYVHGILRPRLRVQREVSSKPPTFAMPTASSRGKQVNSVAPWQSIHTSRPSHFDKQCEYYLQMHVPAQEDVYVPLRWRRTRK